MSRWLEIPSLSQGNRKSKKDSQRWCGRACSCMVHNYYQYVCGNTGALVVNDHTKGDFLYPDGTVAASGYDLSEPLERALPGWRRVSLYPKSARNSPPDDAVVKSSIAPVTESIDRNNPVVLYSGLSRGVTNARHIVVISGYKSGQKGEPWLLIDDPATMRDTDNRNEKSDFLGLENLEILDGGEWYKSGCRYWIKARRLFEPNDHSAADGDLWCDHGDRPGFVVWLNKTTTKDSPFVHVDHESKADLVFPLSLPFSPTDLPHDLVYEYFSNLNESAGIFGHFPIGFDMQWHGGMHIPARQDSLIHNIHAGGIVAAKLNHDSTTTVSEADEDGETEERLAEQPSNGFVIVKHELRDPQSEDDTATPFFSLHLHLADETRADTKIPWLRRLLGRAAKSTTYYRPNANANGQLVLWENRAADGANRPKAMGGSAGLAKGASGTTERIRTEFAASEHWSDGQGNTFALLEHNGAKRWACVRSGATSYADCHTEEADGEGLPAQVKELMAGEFVSFHDADEDLAAALRLEAGEPVGRAGRMPIRGSEVYGEHLEIFSGADLAKGDTVAGFDELPGRGPEGSTAFLKLTDVHGSFPDRFNAPLRDKGAFDTAKKPPLGEPLPVHGLHEDGADKFALVEIAGEKRWVVYEWPDGRTVRKDGEISTHDRVRWVLIDDSGRSEITYDKQSMYTCVDWLRKADPSLHVPANILKRTELADFYRANTNRTCLRHTYVHGISEWSIDMAAALDTDRMAFLKQHHRDKRIAGWKRYALWKNLPEDLLRSDGFASKVEGTKLWQYRYHPVTFLRWLGEKTGVGCVVPEWKGEEDSSELGERREIVFAETTEEIDPQFRNDYSFIEQASGRWLYVFDAPDGKAARGVWEIQVNDEGDFASYQLTEQNYASRSEHSVELRDTVALPATSGDGSRCRYFACLTEFRLPEKRLFHETKGIVRDVSKRCDDIDDESRVKRGVGSNGIEMIGLVNYLAQAETRRRKNFDEVYELWQHERLHSTLETDPESKKQKLLYELGALILQVVEAIPDHKKHLNDYVELHDYVEAVENRKKENTGKMHYEVGELCSLMTSERFGETCWDYLSMIREGDEQCAEIMGLEERLGNLVDGLDRFPEGIDTVRGLLPDAAETSAHTWLQELLTLGNAPWGQGSEGTKPTDDTSPSPVSKMLACRKIGDGLGNLMIVAFRAGVKEYTPERMAASVRNVLRTTGESFAVSFSKVSRTEVRPFATVVGTLSPKSFWCFSFDDNIMPYDSAVTRFIKGENGLSKLLDGLEGIAAVYSLMDALGNEKAGRYERGKAVTDLVIYIAQKKSFRYGHKLVKIGKGPVAVANTVMSALDCVFSVKEAKEEFAENDPDTAVWNLIAAGGYGIAAIGNGALMMCFLAGVAGLGGTGIGLPVAGLLAFAGTAIAIGAEIMEEHADDTELEILLQQTPWGTKAVSSPGGYRQDDLQKGYLEMVRMLNSFRIEIDTSTQRCTLHISTLEPESVITLHKVAFGKATFERKSTYEETVVGSEIRLSDVNTRVLHDSRQGGAEIVVDLMEVCGLGYDHYWTANRPDFILIEASADIKGDETMILPAPGEYVSTRQY